MLTQARLKALLSYDPVTGEFRWRTTGKGRRADRRAGAVNGQGYMLIGVDYERHPAHRLAWLYMTGTWPPMLDHRDGNKRNNAFANLRICTKSENARNSRRPAHNSTGLKGVSRSRRSGKFAAFICVAGKNVFLGEFSSAVEAHAAYAAAAHKHFQSYARLA